MIRLSLKPIFIGWSTLVAQLPLQLFFTLWCGGFFGGMYISFTGQKSEIFLSPPVILFGSAAFILFPLVIYVSKKLNYQKTDYKFYDDRLEFDEGFFTLHNKVIKFKDVKEVSLRRGILQRVNGLGTIYLATTATGSMSYANPFSAIGFGSTSASGISVRDIKNPDQEYQNVRKLVDAANV